MERFKKFSNGYIMDRRMHNIFFFLACAVLLPALVVQVSNAFKFGAFSLSCEEEVCFNPMFEACKKPICQQEFLYEGFSYNEPAWWVEWSQIVAIIIYINFWVANTLIHNKGVLRG